MAEQQASLVDSEGWKEASSLADAPTRRDTSLDKKVLISPGSIALDNWKHTAKPSKLGDIADEGARRIKANLAEKQAAARRTAARSSAKARQIRDRLGTKPRTPLSEANHDLPTRADVKLARCVDDQQSPASPRAVRPSSPSSPAEAAARQDLRCRDSAILRAITI